MAEMVSVSHWGMFGRDDSTDKEPSFFIGWGKPTSEVLSECCDHKYTLDRIDRILGLEKFYSLKK